LPPATTPSASVVTHPKLFAMTAASHRPSLPTHPKTAAAYRMTATYGGGGPSSAFRKPYMNRLILKENLAPAVSREDSPTQSPGLTMSRDTMSTPSVASFQALLKENQRLQQQLQWKEDMIASLKTKADGLEKQIGELRQLPTGKISHIPVE
jgi:hypothetical protein